VGVVALRQLTLLQEFFSARDEPEPEFVQEAGQSAKSPNPKYRSSSIECGFRLKSLTRAEYV
jgi:hypothetical protein